MTNEAITVGVRLRPLVAHEKGQQHCVQISSNEVSLVGDHIPNDEKNKRYGFDYAMDSSDKESPDYVSQEKCYELMGRRMKEHMAEGFNTCLFCYGQTGTGKTTTIMGQAKPVSEQGVLMRFLNEVFKDVEQQKADGYTVEVEVMMLEVYNEKLNNLLLPEEVAKKRGTQKLEVHVHPEIGVVIKGAIPENVESFEEVLKLIEYGNAMKSVRATAMNNRSSRGHTIFRLNMERSGGNEARKVKSEVYFADLAGRENEKTTQVSGDGRIELTFINKSLHFLANCIQSLASDLKEKEKPRRRASLSPDKAPDRRSTVLPTQAKVQANNMGKFRNSKLTLILANALSGNSRTAMIGTLSPSVNNLDETISTLKFAATVKTIKLQAKAVTVMDKDQVVANLKDEVARLKAELTSKRQSLDYDQKLALQTKLEDTESLAMFMDKDMKEQRLQALSNKKLREQTLRRVSFDCRPSDSDLPHLLNYCDDRYLAFKIAFYVPDDGKEYSAGTQDTNKFRLPPGPGVCSTTCYLSNKNNQLWIRTAAIDDSEKYLTVKGRKFAHIEVNDDTLDEESYELHHLDKVIFGRSTVFYVFKHKATQEALDLLRLEQEEYVGVVNEDSKTISALLGEERASDKMHVGNAEEYLRLMRSHHKDNEGQTALTWFLHRLKSTKKLIDEANDITEALRPKSGLVIELSTMAPILSLGYGVTAHPEICARLLRRISAAKARWQYAVKCIKHSVSSGRLSFLMAMDTGQDTRCRLKEGYTELIALWTLPTFEARLEVMRDYFDSKKLNGDFELPLDDPTRDPWCVSGVSATLKKEIDDARHYRKNANSVKFYMQQKLDDILRENQDLERQLEAFRVASSKGPTWGVASELQRCIDLSRSNQKFVEDFVQEQAISREQRKANDAKLARLRAFSIKRNDHRRWSELTSEVGHVGLAAFGNGVSSDRSTSLSKSYASILVVLKREYQKYALLVTKVRNNVPGIPTGMFSSAGRVMGACLEEMEEEIGEVVKSNELLDMTEMALRKSRSKYDSEGGSPSFGGVNTCQDSVFLFRQVVTAQQFQALQRRIAGRQNRETVLQIIPIEDLWQYTSDSKALSALCLYEKLIASGKLRDF